MKKSLITSLFIVVSIFVLFLGAQFADSYTGNALFDKLLKNKDLKKYKEMPNYKEVDKKQISSVSSQKKIEQAYSSSSPFVFANKIPTQTAKTMDEKRGCYQGCAFAHCVDSPDGKSTECSSQLRKCQKRCDTKYPT